ncbi:hypothetical protein [Bacteroides caecimuris]|nr:hypothetical protein [Bacteroides caecimuris]
MTTTVRDFAGQQLQNKTTSATTIKIIADVILGCTSQDVHQLKLTH